jgi:hypothetical protein
MRCVAILIFLFPLSLVRADEEQRPAKPVDPAELKRLIEQLDADTFDDREAAVTALVKLGDQAKEAIAKAVEATNSEEVKIRGAHILKQIRIQELQRNALKLDSVYQMARDVCDGKAKAEDLEPILDRILEVIAATDPAAARVPPVKISDCKPTVARGAVLGQALLVGQPNTAHLRGSTAVLDVGGHISHATDSIVIAWGVLDISHATNCIVIAGGDVSIAHAQKCTILAGGMISISHTTNCTLGSGELLEPGWLNERCVLVNSKVREGRRVPGRAGEVVSLEVAGLVLREKPVMEELLTEKLMPTFMSEKFMTYKVPGQPGEFVARPGTDLVDPFGKPVPGLEGWKLVLSAEAFAAFASDKQRTFVRFKQP